MRLKEIDTALVSDAMTFTARSAVSNLRKYLTSDTNSFGITAGIRTFKYTNNDSSHATVPDLCEYRSDDPTEIILVSRTAFMDRINMVWQDIIPHIANTMYGDVSTFQNSSCIPIDHLESILTNAYSVNVEAIMVDQAKRYSLAYVNNNISINLQPVTLNTDSIPWLHNLLMYSACFIQVHMNKLYGEFNNNNLPSVSVKGINIFPYLWEVVLSLHTN